MPLAILLFGPMADVISVELILIISGVLLIMVGYFYHLSSRKLLIV
jgi:DHA3 family macrolide efflux protein-like MFS transporter